MMEKTKELIDEKIKYFPNAKVVCSCGAKYEVGSTLEKISIEICANCHPFYTGTQKFIDSAGRLEKFNQRVDKAKKYRENKENKKTSATPLASKTENK